MRTKLFLLWTFCRRFLPALLVINLACAHLVGLYGPSILGILIWFKLLSDGVLFYLVHKLRRTEFFYFRNLGLTEFSLWTFTFLADILLFALGLTFTLQTHLYA